MPAKFSLAMKFLVTGILLLLLAYIDAKYIPSSISADAVEEVNRHGGSMPTSDLDVYRQLDAQSRMLQNAYVGGGGLILFLAGTLGLVFSSAAKPHPIHALEKIHGTFEYNDLP